MPLYEYQCESCGFTFEVIQKFSDPAVETCRNCGGKVRRLPSAPAIQFKGSGWYVTDYAHKGMTDAEHDKPSRASSANRATDKKPASADSKGETPASSSSTPKG